MTSLMQQALGADWDRLPAVLQAHYRPGTTVETGHLDVEFPRALTPLMWALGRLGALVHRRGRGVATRVEKRVVGDQQFWRRTLRYADGQVIRFDSRWTLTPGGRHVVEFVNPVLGLEMAPEVVAARPQARLSYCGVCFIVRLGPLVLRLPQWLGPGATTIVEEALDERRFAMDFRMTHPWFGELFRYSGVFEVATPPDAQGSLPSAPPCVSLQHPTRADPAR